MSTIERGLHIVRSWVTVVGSGQRYRERFPCRRGGVLERFARPVLNTVQLPSFALAPPPNAPTRHTKKGVAAVVLDHLLVELVLVNHGEDDRVQRPQGLHAAL